MSERIKLNAYRGYTPQYYFWRTYDQQEIDLIEVNSRQEMSAFECKWKPSKVKIPLAFKTAYPEASFTQISPINYLEYITAS